MFQNEPVVIAAIVNAGAALAAIFGFHLTPEQTAAVIVVATLITSLVVRAHVTPTAKT